jgi:hypothetical protein
MEDEKKTKVQSAIIGSAGEHLVISLLLRRNFIAGLAPQNTEDFDIVVMSKDGQTLFPVQVKTSTKKSWMLSKKHENAIKNLIYVFVRFSDDMTGSEIFIMKSNKVSEVTKLSHQIWLKIPSKGGKVHQDSDIRNLMMDSTSLIKNLSDPKKYLTQIELDFIDSHKLGWIEKYRDSWDIFK